MHRRRVLLYFTAVATMIIAATVAAELLLVLRVVEHARQADLRFATGVAHHVATSLAEQEVRLAAVLARLPVERGEQAVREALRREVDSSFEPNGIAAFSDQLWNVGAERSPGGSPPREVLLPALRRARQTGRLVETALWWGSDDMPRVSLVVAATSGARWRAVAGSMRLDGRAFLGQFGFFLTSEDVRLQLVDGAGVALFSTVPRERYRSVVHGTYLLDSVLETQAAQLRCHGCHEEAGSAARREDEVATLARVAGSSWSVLLREDPAELRGVLTETVVTLVVLICLILGAFGGFYALLTWRVLRPMRQLASAASAVSVATAQKVTPPAPVGDLELLERSFEAMLGDLSAAPPPAAGLPPRPLLPPAADAVDVETALRQDLERMLAAAVDGYRKIELVTAIVVTVEGEAIGEPPLVVATPGAEAVRQRASDAYQRTELRALDGLRGEVWIGATDTEAARHLMPISVLITLQVQAIVDRGALSSTLSQEHSEKTRMLGHLFEAEAAERKRIAREIHDDTSQALTALLLSLGAFPLEGSAQQQAEAVRTAEERVGDIIDSTNRIMKRLRPALLDDLGLLDALRALGEDVLTAAGLRFELEAPDEALRAPAEVEDAVFRVFQEGAANIVRHAHAHRVMAGLRAHDGRIVGWLEDDGRGLEPRAAARFGDRPRFGLLGMRERITQLGGTFQLSTPKSGGLRIDISVPVDTAARAVRVAG